MATQIVIALYRPHKGKEKELEAVIKLHIPALKKAGLITERPSLLMKSSDGTYLEIFEWKSNEAANQAHSTPAVGELWEAMGAVCDFPSLNTLPEADKRFPHFEPITL